MIESFHLYITGKEAYLRRQTGLPWRRRVEVVDQWHWDPAVPASLLRASMGVKKWYRPRLHVYVGSALCKFMAVALPLELHAIDELRAAGQAKMQHQLGLNAADWVFTLDSASPGGKAIVCAARRNVMDRVHELTAKTGLRLWSLKPYVVGIWNVAQKKVRAATPSATALIAIEEDAFTVWMTRAGILDAMNTLGHAREPELVSREMKRLAFILGDDANENIGLALAPSLSSMMPPNAGKLLLRSAYVKENRYADFRDLLFHPGVR